MVARATLTRRGLLGLLAGVTGLSVAAGCGDGEPRTSGIDPDDRVSYGQDHPDQYGVLRLPEDTDATAVVVLLHGGFWRSDYGADLMTPLADDLNSRGFATWNVEYRRVGDGGGFPATLEDVAAAVDFLREMAEVDGLPVYLVGHSAGGHLAAWAASRTAATPGGRGSVLIDLTVSLSGILCLAAADVERVGNGAATEFMGAGLADRPDDYDRADPVRLLPPQGRVVAVHAAEDRVVPAWQSSDYTAAARSSGGQVELMTVPGDHFDLIDPGSDAWADVVSLLE